MISSIRVGLSTRDLEMLGMELGFHPNLSVLYARVLGGQQAVVDSDLDKLLGLMSHEITTKGKDSGRSLRCKYVLALGLRQLVQGKRLSSAGSTKLNKFIAAHMLYVPDVLTVDLPHGAKIECHMDEYVQMLTWLCGGYESTESYVLSSIVQSSMCIIDAGANIGQYTVQFGKLIDANGSLHAFEPVDHNYRALIRNVLRNRLSERCITNEKALWDKELICEAILPEECQGECPNHGAFYLRETSKSTPRAVTCIDLDTYCDRRRIERVHVIKIDVEGNEARVLLGARRVIERNRPIVVMEVNKRALERVGSSLEELSSVVFGLGFSVINIGSSSASCEKLGSLTGVDYSNVLLYAGIPPEIMNSDWDQASVQRWVAASTTSQPRSLFAP